MAATTALISDQKSLLWKIPNFAEALKSKELLKKQHFRLEMSLVGDKKEVVPIIWGCYLNIRPQDKDSIGLFIYAKSVPPELSNAHARIHCQILDQEGNGDRRYYFDATTTFSIQQSVDTKRAFGFPQMLPKRSEDTPFLRADGSLEIRVTVTVFYDSAEQEAELAALEAKYETRFASELKKEVVTVLQDNPLLTNISDTKCKIVSRDGKELLADRVVLAARSSVFRAMFQSNMTEEQKGVVEVKDMDSEPLQVLLHFICAGELTTNWRKEGVIEGLVYGAHKYMLEGLKDFLNKVVGLVCTDGNCGKLMGLAKTFGMKTAEEKLFEYFKKNLANNMEQVMKFARDSDMAATTPMIPAVEEPQPKKSKLSEDD